jgi:hypothetical protein
MCPGASLRLGCPARRAAMSNRYFQPDLQVLISREFFEKNLVK